MRLKLFATPHLCLLTSMLSNKELMHSVFGPRVAGCRTFLVFAILAGMAYQGVQNINEQLAMKGEYNNPEQEHLFRWIVSDTKKGQY